MNLHLEPCRLGVLGRCPCGPCDARRALHRSKEMDEFKKKMEDVKPEIQELVDKNFWYLVGDDEMITNGGKHVNDGPTTSGPEPQTQIEECVPTSANDTQEGGDHYKKRTIQPWDYIADNNIGWLEGNIIKYVTRWRDKNGMQDLKKVKHYLEKLMENAERDGF